MTTGRWQFWIDRGGSFTDIVARRPDGRLVMHKLLSEDPAHYADAAIAGMRDLLGLAPGEPITAAQVDCVKMGTTVATNALLERKGEPTALFITAGFGDALRIGYQNRPRLFDRHIVLPEPLYARVDEVHERLSAEGEVLQPLNEADTLAKLRAAHAAGLRAVAIVLMHGYRYPQHEARIAELAADAGYTQISASHIVSPSIKLIARGETAVIDAYLHPVLQRYLQQLAAQLPGVRLMFMQSNGGLAEAAHFRGKDAVLSGPAGGIVGMVRTAAAAGHDKLIGFDMGGTSTDVSHYDGDYQRVYETELAGVRVHVPMLDIHTVAAGGGSVLSYDGTRLRVGPESAGAYPGPACYRNDGPLTITDCNLLLGKLQPALFPAVFGAGANEPLDRDIVVSRFAGLAQRIAETSGVQRTPEQLAAGYIDIAVANMASAIKKISVQRGYDVGRYTLVCFGGAAGQHACLVADALSMRRVLLHPLAGVLSALGMGLADMTTLREQSVETPLDDAGFAACEAPLAGLCTQAHEALIEQGLAARHIVLHRQAQLRYDGQDSMLPVAWQPLPALREAFERAYRQRFGFVPHNGRIVVAALIVEARGAAPQDLGDLPTAAGSAAATANLRCYLSGQWYDTPVFHRDQLAAGQHIAGPAIIADRGATTIIEPAWQAEVLALGELLLTRGQPGAATRAATTALGSEADPVLLEIFGNRYMSIAEQMGYTLANTAQSVNIKERLDYSCALFDEHGALIANAPHIPVHLGSMSDSVREVIRVHGAAMQRGDAYVLNNPYRGGTHLPDITVVTPVFDASAARPVFYVASRGHHADVGGITPGSMPAGSQRIEDEGVLLDNLLLMRDGRLREDELRRALAAGPYPARRPEQNLADLRAQIGANQQGVQALQALMGDEGLAVAQAYARHLQDQAEAAVRRAIGALSDGDYTVDMDDGAQIRVRISIEHATRSATIDFSGSSAQRPNNYNAPAAITRAAVLYVFRCLVDADIPLNEGCLRPLRLIIPGGSMLNPQPPAAIVAGNVETSQAIVDALFGALGVMAGAQGTMNNFTFGDAQHQYYETLCGGAGAGADFDGASAVQTHMTNSRLTDPEVLESRFPVLLERFAIRSGSGGEGLHRGGDGVIRELRFRQAMQASILSNHRRVPPRGLHGGGDGAAGRNAVRRADGQCVDLPATAVVDMAPGDCFIIETPGGGGYGRRR